MTEEKRLSDAIIEAGDDFAVDAMEDFDARVASGEFANKTIAEIRSIYLNEAIDHEEQEDLQKSIDEANARDEEDEY